MIRQTSVLISSKIWAIENKLEYWLIAVPVPPLKKGKDGRVDDVCYTCTALLLIKSMKVLMGVVL